MPNFAERPTPHLSVSILENILNSTVLLPAEKTYIFNRVVGEYAAYSVLSHLEDVDKHDDSLLNEDVPQSWRSIDDTTRDRYRSMLSILRDTNARRNDMSYDLHWNWLTLRAMQTLREAARSSDDALSDIVGPDLERSKFGDEVWQKYFESVDLDGSKHVEDKPLTTQDVDRFIEATATHIRHRYLEQTDPSTPYLNEYADAACRGEQETAYNNLVDLGRTVDENYQPSLNVRQAAHMSIVTNHVRPTKYDVVAALENGEFKDLLDKTVMTEDEFDDLMSDAMEVYMDDHRGDGNVLEEATTLMDTAEREAGRPIVWRESETRDLLREEQNVRDQAVATTSDPSVEPQAVSVDANGLPELTHVDQPEHPSLLEQARIGYENAQVEEEVAQLEASGELDATEGEQIEQAFANGDAEAGREALRRAEEEAAELEQLKTERELADSIRELTKEESPSV